MEGQLSMQTMNVVKVAHKLLLDKLKVSNCIFDATAGNGNDTIFLAENSPDKAKIYAFDIQQSALDATKLKLQETAFLEKVSLILASHDKVDEYIKANIDIAMFNLGYLPGGDHTITTVAETTIAALEKTITLLNVNGIIAITAYTGHDAGAIEYSQLVMLLMNLPVRNFTVGCYSMMNHAKTSPVLYLVEKVRS
ncbi:MAG: rRNA methylase [Massilibacillus sp.]|nr:rRNA methylase [Massilibacillus sp.]